MRIVWTTQHLNCPSYINRVGRKTYMPRAACPGETWPEEPLVGAGPPPSNGAGPLRRRHAAARGFCMRAIHISFSPLPLSTSPIGLCARARVAAARSVAAAVAAFRHARCPVVATLFSTAGLDGTSTHRNRRSSPRETIHTTSNPAVSAVLSYRVRHFSNFSVTIEWNNIVKTVESSFSHIGLFALSANVYTQRVFDGVRIARIDSDRHLPSP